MILQIVELRDYSKFPNVVAFDEYGKIACLDYFNLLFQHFRKEGIIYHRELRFDTSDTYTYQESYFKIQDGRLVKANSFADCNFYERSFFTVDTEGRDMGIVNFVDYTILNSGITMKRPT